MKNFPVLFLAILFFSVKAYAQGGIMEKIEAINVLEEEGKLEPSIELTKELISLLPPGNNDVLKYSIAKKYAQLQNVDSSFHYLFESITRDSSLKALTEPAFYFLINDDRWLEIENLSIQKYESKNGSIPNVKLAKELFRLGIRDQAFYYQIEIVEKDYPESQLIYQAIWELKIKINKENISSLEEIVAQYGWPKIAEVTTAGTQSAFFIIQHATDIEKQKKFLPIMKDAANKGEIELSNIAYLTDRINLREGRPQLYGTQLDINADGTFNTESLFEPEYVNQRRQKMNMSSIEEYLQKSGLEWTIEQKVK